MAQPPKKRSPGGMSERFRRAREDDLRREFSEPSPDIPQRREAMRPCAEGALASVPALEHLYLKDRNPVHVWDGIMQIGFAMRTVGKPIQFPPWITAYLVRVSEEIMGIAVNRPQGDRQMPKSPTRNPDGTMNFYSDYFGGVTPPQRRDLVMEALGFKGAKGWNPLAQAHRDQDAEFRRKQIDALRSTGLSVRAAAESLNDPQLKKVDDPERKIRRERKRLCGET